MRALVFANGQAPSSELIQMLAIGAELLVAADGGAALALGAGLVPNAVVGDFDSLSPEVRGRLPIGVLYPDEDPESTDLAKAMAFALERGVKEIDVVGAGGGRADHALANLSLLLSYRGRAVVRVHDDNFTISLVEGFASIHAPMGTVVSLVALGSCTGVTTSGLRWPLSDYTLEFGPRGIHNEVVSNPASVAVASGDLLLFLGRWIEKHG